MQTRALQMRILPSFPPGKTSGPETGNLGGPPGSIVLCLPWDLANFGEATITLWVLSFLPLK